MEIDKKETMFDTGDAIIHPTLGAGIVIGLPNFLMQKQSQQYYKIKILSKTKTTIMVPVKSARKLGLRHAVSSLEMDSVWRVLSDSVQNLPNDNKARSKVLQDKAKMPGIFIIAEIIRDLEWQKQQKGHLNSTDRRIYDHAMDMLAGEIAVSLDVQMQSARTQIKKVLDVNMKNSISQYSAPAEVL